MGDDRADPDARDLERRWEAVRGRMEAASHLLARQGSVASRLTGGGLRVHSLRFVEVVDGRRRQRAIHLGRGGELVRRARALIEGYRERERQVREVEEAARFAAASSVFVRSLASSQRRRLTRLGAS